MQIKVYSQKDSPTSSWTGGSTTQLWILPQDGDYASRNFRARISSATVRLSESDFTALPGVTRYITPLQGGFTLSHPDGKTVTMAPLDTPYRFDGGIDTHCSGMATDFNLMLKGVEGNMEIVNGRQIVDSGIYCLYSVHGGSLAINGEVRNILPGDLVVIHKERDEEPVIETTTSIVCKIFI